MPQHAPRSNFREQGAFTAPTQGSVGAGPAGTREERADEDVGAEKETMEIKREELKD